MMKYFFIIIFIFSGCCECKYKVVKTIGGCQQHACGVEFDDGSYGQVSFPVVGRKMQVCQ